MLPTNGCPCIRAASPDEAQGERITPLFLRGLGVFVWRTPGWLACDRQRLAGRINETSGVDQGVGNMSSLVTMSRLKFETD